MTRKRTLSLAEDHRARVPFALVGVLLLVGSAALSASLAVGPTQRTDDSVGTAMDQATAATNTALRDAITQAGREAASKPITEPANTTAGSVLNDSSPYRDYLRIRIYLAAREALDSVSVRERSVEGEVALPAPSNASALRKAKRRVEISSVGSAENGGLRVHIENVTVTAKRNGRVIERTRISPTIVTTSAALALHERTERFESRLNRGPLEPGLGRRLTARLYPVTWARGYAQYGGAPIANVVANRHVELATNGALLREQRAAFGRSDPRGRRALTWATARVGATDLLTATHEQRGTRRTKLLLTAANRYQKSTPMPGGLIEDSRTDASRTNQNRTNTTRTNARLRVGVNRTADRAFDDLVTGERGTDRIGPPLSKTLQSAYSVETRLVATVQQTSAEERPKPEPPGENGSADLPRANWTLESNHVTTRMTVENVSDSVEETPGIPLAWHRLQSESRRVVRTRALVSNWTRGNETRQTVQQWTETFVVSIGVAGDHGASVPPDRPIAGVHERPVVAINERGDSLDGSNLQNGSNLQDVPSKATEELVQNRGGFDALARRAVTGTLDTRPQELSGRRPAGLEQWVYRDLVALRERVRNVSVEVPPNSSLGGQPPAATLARALRAHRGEFVKVPETYSGVADRARVAVRAAYFDRVLARLDARADRANETRQGVGQALAEAGVSLDRARRVLRDRTTPETPPPTPMPAAGPGAAVNLSVAGAPPYLTLAELDHEQVGAIPEGESDHPLAARNVNVFAVPYGDLADEVESRIYEKSGQSGQAEFQTAGLALRAANRTLEARENATLEERRNDLQTSLSASVGAAERALVAKLGMAIFGLTRVERQAAVRGGFAEWNTTAGQALALANGSVAEEIAEEVVRQQPTLRTEPSLGQSARRDLIRLRVELAVEATRQSVDGPPRSKVGQTDSTTRRIARTVAKKQLGTALETATKRASNRWFGEVLGAVPAGLPVAPVPGYWYATVNVWKISVRGHYARFSVRAPQGPPGEEFAYTREPGVVELDVDGDGDEEILGRTEPVSFETETVVVVVVPPGPPGVGDRGGNRDERSSGWTPD